MAQTKTIQLLRSTTLYASKEEARSAIIGRTAKDGEVILARYQSGTDEETGQLIAKSLLGIYHATPNLTPSSGSVKAGWTVIEDSSTVDAILEGLDFTTGNMAFEGGSAADDSVIVVGVAQNNGQLDAVVAELGSVKVNSVTATSATSKIAADQTLTENLGRLQGQIDDMDLTARANATTDGQVVVTISQIDGKVSETVANLSDVKMTGYASSDLNTGNISANDTLEEALNKVENAIAANKVTAGDASITMGKDANNGNDTVAVNIKSGERVLALSSTSGAGGLYTDLDLVKITKGLPTNVKERYQLLATDDTQIGTNIDVYKDSALLSVKLLHATDSLKPTYNKSTNAWTDIDLASQAEANVALCYAYENANGDVVVEAVPVGNFLRESEFKNGLQVVGGEVSVLVDPTSESVITAYSDSDNTTVPVLSVSSAGVKVSNIQAAIDAAVNNATAGLAVTAAGDNVYISAAQDANDNKKINVTGTYGSFNTPTAQSNTLSATTNGIAKAEDVATAVNTVISNLDGEATATAESGNVYTVLTSVTEANGVIAKGSEVTLAAVAKTGAAADVSIADAGSLITAENVEGALQEIAGNLNAAKVVANDVITVDATNNTTKLAVTTGDGLEKVSNALKVKDGNGIIVDANGVSVNAGNGLEIADDKVKIKLDTATAPNNNFNVTGDMLSISNDGLMMLGTWDCGTF